MLPHHEPSLASTPAERGASACGGACPPKTPTPIRGFAVGVTCVGVDALFFTSPLHAGVVAVRPVAMLGNDQHRN